MRDKDLTARVYEAVLEQQKFAIQQSFGDKVFLSRVTAEAWHDFELPKMFVALRVGIWSEGVGSQDYKIPADWWQAVKARFFPCWLKKKSPVKYRDFHAELKACYPNFRASGTGQKMVLKTFVSELDRRVNPVS